MTAIGPWQVQTFSLVLALAVLLAGALALWRGPGRPAAVFDACLLALATGLLAARGAHVLLHLAHFSVVPQDGALFGLWLGARWRRLDRGELLDALAPAPALLMLAGWRACMATGCGYGREVDTLAHHSPLLVAELSDIYGIYAPRYNTPLFGLLAGLIALLLAGLLHRRRWLTGLRFWLLTLVLAAVMFVIGFWRADSVPQWAGLRSDQWLDVAVMAGCAWPLWRGRRS